MIKKLVRIITEELICSEIIQPEEKSLYMYGIELTVVSLINSIWMIGVSWIIADPILGLLYVLILGSVRTQLGGYHAKTYAGCFFCYNIIFCSSLLICRILDDIRVGVSYILAVGCIYLCIIYRFAPVPSLKKLNMEEKKYAKRKAFIGTVGWLILAVLFAGWKKIYALEIIAVLGISIFLMGTEKIKKQISKRKGEGQ